MPNDMEYSESVYEVQDGYLTHTDKHGRTKKLGPGDRFHPTKKQQEDGALKGKASMVEAAPQRTSSTGADIGLRALEWADEEALDLALANGVDDEAFADEVDPSDADGYTLADVTGFIRDQASPRRAARAAETGEQEEPELEEGESESEAEETDPITAWQAEYSMSPEGYLNRYGEDAAGSELARAAVEAKSEQEG